MFVVRWWPRAGWNQFRRRFVSHQTHFIQFAFVLTRYSLKNILEEEETEEEDDDGDDEGRTDDDEEDEDDETVPALRSASLALTDAAEELNRMRTDTNRDRNVLSRSLIAACADNDVNTVRRLLGDGPNAINEGTDDGESLLSLACSAGYFELAQVS